jgi:energy-coupling factor transporter ATP-binding protein EcfA2
MLALQDSWRTYGGWAIASRDPGHLLDLVSSLVRLACALVVGGSLGSLACAGLRRLGLHWSWAALALLPSLIWLRGTPYSWTLSTSAVLCAVLRGRRRHREDLLLGADLAEIANARRGPVVVLVTLARRLFRAVLATRRAGPAREDRLVIGRSGSGADASVPCGMRGSGRHTLVVGATGSGKTVTQSSLASLANEAGAGAIVVDPKGDDLFRERLAAAAALTGREHIEWAPEGSRSYNPFGSGGAGEIADKALAGERFTEPHYLRQAQRYVAHAVRALQARRLAVSPSTLLDALDPSRLESLARDMPEHESQQVFRYLDALTPRQRADLSGVRDRLAIMVESDLGPWLDPTTPGSRAFGLLDAIRDRAIVYFDLRADARPLLAQMLGAAVVQDLQSAMAALHRSPVPTLVAIDEFAAVSAEHVARLFARARSAGINLLLGTQELSDLRLDHAGNLREQVLGNLSMLIAHRQVVPESAELVSRLGGSRGAWRASQGSDGRWTRSRTRVPLLTPEEIRGMPTGWAVTIEPGGAEARMVRMHLSPPRGAPMTVWAPSRASCRHD